MKDCICDFCFVAVTNFWWDPLCSRTVGGEEGALKLTRVLEVFDWETRGPCCSELAFKPPPPECLVKCADFLWELGRFQFPLKKDFRITILRLKGDIKSLFFIIWISHEKNCSD